MWDRVRPHAQRDQILESAARVELFSSPQLGYLASRLDPLFFIYFPPSLLEQHQPHLALFGSIQQSQRSQFNPLTYCVDSPDSIIAELCDHFRPAIGHCRPSSMGRNKRKEGKEGKTYSPLFYIPLKLLESSRSKLKQTMALKARSLYPL